MLKKNILNLLKWRFYHENVVGYELSQLGYETPWVRNHKSGFFVRVYVFFAILGLPRCKNLWSFSLFCHYCVRSIVLSSLFYVTREGDRFLHRGWAAILSSWTWWSASIMKRPWMRMEFGKPICSSSCPRALQNSRWCHMVWILRHFSCTAAILDFSVSPKSQTVVEI